MRNYSQKLVNYFTYFVKENIPLGAISCFLCGSNKFLNIFKGLSIL